MVRLLMILKSNHYLAALSISFQLVTFNVDATDCGNVRVDQGDGLLASHPIYDQYFGGSEDSSMCYAVAGSQFLDAVRTTESENRHAQLSPITVAIQAKINFLAQWPMLKYSEVSNGRGASGLGIGVISNLYEGNKLAGWGCDREYLKQNGIEDPNPIWKVVENSYWYVKYQNEEISTIAQKLLVEIHNGNFLKGKLLAKVDLDFLKEILAQPGFYQREQLFYNKLCEGHMIDFTLPNISFYEHYSDGGSSGNLFVVDEPDYTAIDRIDSTLSQEIPKPALVDICQQLLMDPDHSYRKSVDGFFSSECAAHSVLIVGRRQNSQSGKCEYLIRNSWGQFRGYDSRWEVDERAQIWIDGLELSKSILAVMTAR